MLFSCKITSTVLSYLENQGEDLTPILEGTALPEEFLRDPSYWMQASEMEAFLERALRRVRSEKTQGLQKLGHLGPELRSWGVLDSVLRIMPRTQEILAQPDRFLAYFVSPAPPIDNIKRHETGLEFDLPILSEQFPLITSYLASSFESLPTYNSLPLAQCEWQGMHVKISWQTDQENIFDKADLGHSLSPDLMRNVLETLEKHSKDLEEKNRDLQERNEALVRGQAVDPVVSLKLASLEPRFEKVPSRSLHHLESSEDLRQNIARLGDYMVRAQQLVTLLVGQGRMSPAVKEAMRRVDWERVQKQFPETLKDCQQILNYENRPELNKGETHV